MRSSLKRDHRGFRVSFRLKLWYLQKLNPPSWRTSQTLSSRRRMQLLSMIHPKKLRLQKSLCRSKQQSRKQQNCRQCLRKLC